MPKGKKRPRVWVDPRLHSMFDDMGFMSDVEFIDKYVSTLPSMISCTSILTQMLFGCGVRAEKHDSDNNKQYVMEEHFRVVFVATWTDFAVRLLHSLLRYGLAVWDLADHEHLHLVPIVYDFATLIVTFHMDKFDRRVYTVNRNGKPLTTARVLEKYPPTREGAINSPMSVLIKNIRRVQQIEYLSLLAMHNGVLPMRVFEHVPEKTSGSAGLPHIPPAFASGRSDVSTVQLDGARLASQYMPSMPQDPKAAQREFEDILEQLECPAQMMEIGDCDDEEIDDRRVMVIRPGYRMVAGDGRAHPYVPPVTDAEKALELAISSSLGVPRVYWSEMESRFQVEMHLARDKLRQTVRHWGTYITEFLQSLWSRVYGKADAAMNASHGLPVTRISLPSMTQLHEFEYMLNSGIIDQYEFNKHVAGLFGWRGLCGDFKDPVAVQEDTKAEQRKTTARIRKGVDEIYRNRKDLWERNVEMEEAEKRARLFPPGQCTSCGAPQAPAIQQRRQQPFGRGGMAAGRGRGGGLGRPNGVGTITSRRGTVEASSASETYYERKKRAAAEAAIAQ